MRLIYNRCAGLDVHLKTVVACARICDGALLQQPVRTFKTTVAGLLALSDWLQSLGVTHAVLESTGIYWQPVWQVLSPNIELTLSNAKHVKNVPGRKTDVSDAMWLAELMAHGLVRGSFVPPPAIQEARDLTRTRTQLTREVGRHTQRIQKTLEKGNIKLSTVLTHVLGVTGRHILEALIAGETDVDRLLALRRGKLKATPEEMREALRGNLTENHRFLLKLHLSHVEEIERTIRSIEERLEEVLRPFRGSHDLLLTAPGVSHTVASIVIAEAGDDMTRFPTDSHIVSWVGLCPGNDESAGKKRSSRTRQGNKWLKTILVQAAWAATRKKDSVLRAKYLRLKARRGAKKAIVAVAADLLRSIYYMLLRREPYEDRLPAPDVRQKQHTTRRLVSRLKNLGFEVQLRPAA